MVLTTSRCRPRLVVAVATVIITALLALGPTGRAAAEPFRLIITDLTTPLVPNSVLDLADRLGYFRREGVDVELVRVQQTPSALAALKAGEGDMANVAVDATLQLVARGLLKAKAVDSPAKSMPYMIVGKAEVATLAQLAHRSFGVGRMGSVDQALTAKVLAGSGIAPDTVDFVSIGQPAARAQALAAGRIDATTVSVGIWTTLPDKTGLHVLMPPPAFHAAAPVVDKVNVVPDAVLATKRDQVVAVVRALVKAARDFANKPQSWIDAVAAARPDARPEDLAALAVAFKGQWSVNGGFNRADLEQTQDWLSQAPEFKDLRKPPLAEWADMSVLRQVLSELGTDGGSDPSLLD